MLRRASSSPPRAGRRAPALYIITDRLATLDRPLATVLERALEGAADAGVTPGTVAVQLREKDLDARPLLALAVELRALTDRFGATLFINDRVDVALAARADGVHLSGTSMSADDVAAIAPALDVAISTHGPADFARAAETSNLCFAVLGPIFETASKQRFGLPLGLDVLAATPATVPVLAIGGVTVDNAPACVAAGAAGIACIRAILSAPDCRRAAFQFCAAILERASPP